MATSQYVGKAGQLAVMSELAFRGYNVAIPEVDIGDDVFAVNDANGNLWRLQVKTASEKRQKASSRYQFRIKHTGLAQSVYPDLHIALVMRKGDTWKYLISSRQVLNNYVLSGQLGKHSGDYQQFYVTLHDDGRVMGSKTLSLQHHMQDWSMWPGI